MVDVGAEINQYKVIEHIGRGGMADVWSARDKRLNRMVAIKTIAHGLSQDADPVSLFKQEAQTIAQMEHPHILPIYDFGEHSGSLYIVMRYVSGGSLEDMLRTGPLPLDEALRLGQAVAQALDYAHSSSVIHLDLKPANVLLDTHRSPYLADFGLATSLDPEGKAANPGSGTLLYMAPEQMTAEVIDHRADIYSFCILLFHMMTGQLPFQGSAPLALKQVQYHEELPILDTFNPNLPAYFTDVLRRGTSVDPRYRQSSLMEIVGELRDVVTTMSNFEMMPISSDAVSDDYDPFATFGPSADGMDASLLEAVDIYSRARHNWSGGNGRFLLGVTHFMLMNGYYMDAQNQGLDLDVEGMQMLLRGALEYDHEVDYWWGKLDDDNRRWVCLHALRSGNAPARVRALYRIETLPDSDPPQIPKLVAQMLQLETDEEARLAALQVLGTRAKIMKPREEYNVRTEYRGRMLTTTTRQGIEVTTPARWREVVFTPEIDLLISAIALDQAMPRVSEAAARVIGRIQSTTAVRYIVKQQQRGRRGALRALALVRDESPNLPPFVSNQGKLYAWFANTTRRLFDNPWGLVFRFVSAFIGGWIAMGLHFFIALRNPTVQYKWANTLAYGMMFGLFISLLVLFSGEFFERVRGFWARWLHLLISMGLGVVLGMVLWAQFEWMYLAFPFNELYWPAIIIGGVGAATGVVVTAYFSLPSPLAIFITTAATYFPILYTWKDYSNTFDFSLNPDIAPLIYYDYPKQVYTLAIPMALIIAVGSHFPRLWRDISRVVIPIIPRRRLSLEHVIVTAVPNREELKSEITPEDLITELDITKEKIESQEMMALTEMDIQQQFKGGQPTDSQIEKPKYSSRRVDVGSGIKVNLRQEYPDSESPTEPKRPSMDDENIIENDDL